MKIWTHPCSHSLIADRVASAPEVILMRRRKRGMATKITSRSSSFVDHCVFCLKETALPIGWSCHFLVGPLLLHVSARRTWIGNHFCGLSGCFIWSLHRPDEVKAVIMMITSWIQQEGEPMQKCERVRRSSLTPARSFWREKPEMRSRWFWRTFCSPLAPAPSLWKGESRTRSGWPRKQRWWSTGKICQWCLLISLLHTIPVYQANTVWIGWKYKTLLVVPKPEITAANALCWSSEYETEKTNTLYNWSQIWHET